MADDSYDDKLLLLDPADNVFVARTRLESGQRIKIGGVEVAVSKTAPTGFKIARRAIPAGEKIVKYGAVIGSAVSSIQMGERVHTENMKSDYISIHTNASDASHIDKAR